MFILRHRPLTLSLQRHLSSSVDGVGLLTTLRESSGVVVIDVRDQIEIATTGRLTDKFEMLEVRDDVLYGEITLAQIMEGGFTLPDDEFEDAFEFSKPPKDALLVFSCAAGVRSASAQKMAIENGYSNTINYLGGANEFMKKTEDVPQ
jgi:rhodanese-related sulfurtransferase